MGAGASRTHSDTGMRRSKSHPPTVSPSKHKQHRALPPLPIQETAPPLPPPRNSTQTQGSNMNSCRHPRRVNSEPEPKNSLFALIPTNMNGFRLNDPVLPQQASEEEFAEIYRVGMSILGENPDKHTNSRKIYTMVKWVLKKIVGNQNQRRLRKIWPIVEEINRLEEELQSESDDFLKNKTADWKKHLGRYEEHVEYFSKRKLESMDPDDLKALLSCPSTDSKSREYRR